MIAYNNQWLHNLQVREMADEALHEQSIGLESHEAICNATPVSFYTPNIYTRIGTALAVLLIVSATCGLLALFLSATVNIPNASSLIYPIMFFAMGIGCYAVAMFFISKKRYYNAGIDNMLIWASGILLFTAFNTIHGLHPSEAVLSLVSLCISLFLTLRFADTLSGIVSFCSLLLAIFYSHTYLGSFGLAGLPFILMVASGGVYYFVSNTEQQHPLYRNCFYYLKLASLVALYACGNYFVVSSITVETFYFTEGAQYALPMGWFFWIWTFAIPVLYIALGIKNKQLMLILTGILLQVSGILTFRYYHSVLPAEIALIIGGILLIVASYLLINYLKTPRGRFTFTPGYSGHEKTAIEQLIDTQIADKHSAHNNEPTGGSGW